MRVRRMRSVLSRVFRYAIATTRAERDPASDLRGALTVPKAKHLAAITTEDRAGDLMRAIEGYSGHAITLFALKLSAHLFVRPGELRQAEWAEFDFDRSVWNIPAEKMKMRRPHRVPHGSGYRGVRRAVESDWSRSLLLSFLSDRSAINVGKHGECGFASSGLRAGGNDRARFSGNGSDASQ